MKESYMRSVVVKALKPLHAVSVENPVGPGTPDINYCEGWLELKALDAWPVRPDTVVRVPHFTQQQRILLTKRAAAGGNVWLLLTVGRTWMLFEGVVAANHVGKVTKDELLELSSSCWHGTPPAAQLMLWLR